MVPNEYEHRQTGRVVVALVALAAILPLRHFVFAAASRDASVLTPLAVVALLVLLVVGVLFSSLTIQVLHGHLMWSLGPGFFRHMLPLERIRDVQVRDNPWLQGLGIRKRDGVRGYAVAGGSAVEIELEDGERIRLGTDDPEGLVRALRESDADGLYR
ncbi:MAG: hypothetical protein P8Z36_17550 [Gemmatimonadota bacterium]|jgi:hypothetical protein